MSSLHCFSLHNLSIRTRPLEFTQPLTETSTRNIQIMFLHSKEWLPCNADNLTAICEPIVYTMCDPQPLSASTACYGDSLTFF
jgi:hypothetical protein